MFFTSELIQHNFLHCMQLKMGLFSKAVFSAHPWHI